MNSTSTRPWLGEFLLLAAIWGSSFLFTRIAAVAFGPLPTAALRVLIASLVLLPLLVWRGQGPVLMRHLKPALAVGVINSGLPFVLYAFAVLHISTGL